MSHNYWHRPDLVQTDWRIGWVGTTYILAQHSWGSGLTPGRFSSTGLSNRSRVILSLLQFVSRQRTFHYWRKSMVCIVHHKKKMKKKKVVWSPRACTPCHWGETHKDTHCHLAKFKMREALVRARRANRKAECVQGSWNKMPPHQTFAAAEKDKSIKRLFMALNLKQKNIFVSRKKLSQAFCNPTSGVQQVHHTSWHHRLLCTCINITWWTHEHIQNSSSTWLMSACGFPFFIYLIIYWEKNVSCNLPSPSAPAVGEPQLHPCLDTQRQTIDWELMVNVCTRWPAIPGSLVYLWICFGVFPSSFF